MAVQHHSRSLARSSVFERAILAVALAAATLAVIAGFSVAHLLHDAHWVNRAGAAVVTLEVLIGAVEIYRQRRLAAVTAALSTRVSVSNPAGRSREKFLRHEVERSERHVLFIALSMAALGEALHGFGDLLYGLVISVI